MKEGIPRIVALEMEELHLEPGADPVYLDAGAFVGHSQQVAREAFELLLRHPGDSPIFLVSGGEMMEERIGDITDSSDLHAELKQLLGPRCLSYTSPAEPQMYQVS
jgi:DNA polymerase-3 subunit alpha